MDPAADNSGSAGGSDSGSLEDGGCGDAGSGTCIGSRCLVTLASSQYEPSGIAVDSTSVYWATMAGVMKLGLDGGAPVTLAPAEGEEIAVDATSVYWTAYGTCGATDGGACDGTVMKVALCGGRPTVLASAQQGPGPIVVDATDGPTSMAPPRP